MSKSLVDRYEQILAQDPSSTAFVELAKALIDRGELGRAIDVCQQGVLHHSASVVGRVLWGKALIHLDRPAEAMEQFDRAVGVDKDNPHAYNLIGEVLLQKGLYRSALPLLRKAVALQPNDARMRDWYDQTQAAVNGGPPPVLNDFSMLDSAAAAVAAQAEAAASEPPPAPEASSPVLPPAALDPSMPTVSEGPGSSTEVPAPPSAPEAPRSPLIGGPLAAPPMLFEAAAPPPPQLGVESPTVIDSSGSLLGKPLAPDADRTPSPLEPSSLLGELSLPPGAAEEPPPPGGSELLGEIPDIAESPAAILQLPKVEVSRQAAEAIAKEYERELRNQLAEDAQKKTFLQQHGVKLAVGTVLTLMAIAAGSGFVITRARHHGKDLKDSLGFAKKSFASDTATGYRAGLQALDQALEMDSSNEESWAMRAYGEALLYAEHGGAAADQKEALKALEQPDVESKFPGLALVSRWYAAPPGEREVAKRAVLSSTLEQAEVKELSGRLLLLKKDSQGAVARFTAAISLSPNNVRALVALGNYYKDAGDHVTALQFYGTAAQLSPQHVERAVGAAESRLALGQELSVALEELDKLPADAEVSPDLAARREVAHARLLAATGKATEAVAALKGGLSTHPAKALEFNLALGEANRMGGDMGAAQKAYEAALKVQPKSEDAREGLGRVLIARDHEREVLTRLPADEDARRVQLVRGAAYAKLLDWKRVRSELQKTQVGGKYPVEAVMYLALADAAEGQAERAQGVLEKAQLSAKKVRSELAVALGQIYWQRGLLPKARAQFEDATKDPLDYEGACSLGRLLVATGSPDKALEPLTLAVARNGAHGEARHALGRLLLALGRAPEGLKQAEAWLLEDPTSAKAQKDDGFALLQMGRLKESENVLNRSVKLDGMDPETHRIRAQLLFARGDGRSAVSELERANKLNPKDPETFCAIGRAYLRQGNFPTAEKAFEAAQREDSASVCGKVGKVAVKLPAVPKGAARELTELAQQAPAAWDRAWAEATLARVQLASGNVREARKSADAATQLGPLLADAYYVQGAASLKLHDEPKAREALEKAVAYEPTQASYHLALAELLARTEATLPVAYSEYGLYLKLFTGKSPEVARVKRLLPQLKKRMARHA